MIISFAAFEGIVFHTSLYPSVVEPDSTTGQLEMELRNEIQRPKPDRDQVLAVGHSRMALLPRVVNEIKPGTGYTFASIALGGTSPRIWYYSLRAVDPTARQYAAIIIPSDDYNEPDTYENQSEREIDLHYLIARLGYLDLLDFPWTFQDKALQWTIVREMILKGIVYKQDFLEFARHPAARIAKTSYFAQESAGWIYGYGGINKTLAGLEVDWTKRTIHFPDGVPESARRSIHDELLPSRPEDRGRETAYLRYWYGRIADYYRGSGTKLIFLQVPRGAVAPPDAPLNPASAVREIASRPDVVVLDQHLFNQLEHPDLFWDGWHLNRSGMEQFSRILAAEVRRVLGPPKS